MILFQMSVANFVKEDSHIRKELILNVSGICVLDQTFPNSFECRIDDLKFDASIN